MSGVKMFKKISHERGQGDFVNRTHALTHLQLFLEHSDEEWTELIVEKYSGSWDPDDNRWSWRACHYTYEEMPND